MRCWRSSWAELWQNPAGPDLATTAGWEAMLTAPTRVPLTVDTGTGLLSGVRQVLSPNFDARPAGATPEVLIVHGISLPPGEFGTVDRPPVHGHAAGGWASVLPRSRHGAPVGSCPHPPRRADRAIRALRRARLARGRFAVPWPLGVQRLLDRSGARRHG